MSSYSERIIVTTDSLGNRVRNIVEPEKSVNKPLVTKETIKIPDSPNMVNISKSGKGS